MRNGTLGTAKHQSLQRSLTTLGEAIDREKVKGVGAILKIGEHLKLANELLANNKNGQFNTWVKQRCGFTPRSAYRYIGAFEKFGYCDTVSQYFDACALYALSSESCPPAATREALRRAENGERVTRQVARKLITDFTVEADGTTTGKLPVQRFGNDDGPASDPIITGRFDDLLGRGFATIYADPPWHYQNTASRAAAEDHYPTMTMDHIAALPVTDIAATDAYLHLWATAPLMPECLTVLAAWGFTYKSQFIWAKTQFGLGNYYRVSHEILLLGVRGKPPTWEHSPQSWIVQARREHSRKPTDVRAMIEQNCPAPRVELFARECVPGWSAFGNELRIEAA